MNHSPIPGKIRYCFGLSKIFLFFIRSLEFATMASSKISTLKSVFQKRDVSPTVSFHYGRPSRNTGGRHLGRTTNHKRAKSNRNFWSTPKSITVFRQ